MSSLFSQKSTDKICDVFFRNTYLYLCPGMLVSDRITLALRLMQIRADYEHSSIEKAPMDMLMKGKRVMEDHDCNFFVTDIDID